MVSSAVLLLLLSMVLVVTGMISKSWTNTRGRMQAFSDARMALGQIGGTLNQAVLNPYWDYDVLPNPTSYQRYSELQFLATKMANFGALFPAGRYPTCGVFFQAPTGVTWDKDGYGNLPEMLNAYGYFIEFGSDANERPSFLPPIGHLRYRYRLKQWQLPSEKLELYKKSAVAGGKNYLGPATLEWINFGDATSRSIAENVIALIVLPQKNGAAGGSVAMSGDYFYNSRNNGTSTIEIAQKHQLPPTVEIVLVAIDEASAQRIQGISTEPPLLVKDSLFQDSNLLEQDLQQLQNDLDALKIRYVVLRSTIAIRASRWSAQ